MLTNTSNVNPTSCVEKNSILNYCLAATSALIFYEYAITLGREIQFVWGSKMSTAVMIFYLNRCNMIGLLVSNVLWFFPWDTVVRFREVVYLLSHCMTITNYAMWAVVSAFRLYAVSGHNWCLATVTFILGSVPVGTNIFTALKISYEMAERTCSDTLNLSLTIMHRSLMSFMEHDCPGLILCLIVVTIATRLCAIASDLVVLLVIWYHTYDIAKCSMQTIARAPLARLLLADGTLYFLILLLLNVVHLSLCVLDIFYHVAGVFIVPMSSILISRFVLRLRKVYYSADDTESRRPSFIRTVDVRSSQSQQLTIMFAPGSTGSRVPLEGGGGSYLLASEYQGGHDFTSSEAMDDYGRIADTEFVEEQL